MAANMIRPITLSRIKTMKTTFMEKSSLLSILVSGSDRTADVPKTEK